MPWAAVVLLTALVVGLLGCDSEAEPSAPPSDAATQTTQLGGDFVRLQPVHRSYEGRGVSPAEQTKARKIMEGDPLMSGLLDDGGGYSIKENDIGPINARGPNRFIGVIAILRLNQPVSGTYELPLTCYGVSGPPFQLPSASFELRGVRALYVMTGFDQGRVVDIDPTNGDWDLATGASYPEAPRSCERRADQEEGA